MDLRLRVWCHDAGGDDGSVTNDPSISAAKRSSSRKPTRASDELPAWASPVVVQ